MLEDVKSFTELSVILILILVVLSLNSAVFLYYFEGISYNARRRHWKDLFCLQEERLYSLQLL